MLQFSRTSTTKSLQRRLSGRPECCCPRSQRACGNAKRGGSPKVLDGRAAQKCHRESKPERIALPMLSLGFPANATVAKAGNRAKGRPAIGSALKAEPLPLR